MRRHQLIIQEIMIHHDSYGCPVFPIIFFKNCLFIRGVIYWSRLWKNFNCDFQCRLWAKSTRLIINYLTGKVWEVVLHKNHDKPPSKPWALDGMLPMLGPRRGFRQISKKNLPIGTYLLLFLLPCREMIPICHILIWSFPNLWPEESFTGRIH